MPPLCIVLALGFALASAWPGTAVAQPGMALTRSQSIDIAAHVREASQRFGIPEDWILAVIRIESAGRIRAISPAGAMGLMQLMPGTWARQRERFALGRDPFDPRDNILAGTSYLREMYDRYGAAGFLAAYNAGPGRYEEWRDKGRPLPLETRRYVASMAALLQPERNFIAAGMQPASAVPPVALPEKNRSRQGRSASGRAIPANPFATPEVPAHDLFAPVSTARDQ